MTIETLVRSAQRERRLCIVIEAPEPPAVGIVAVFTRVPQASKVDVGVFVAARAVERSLLEPWCQVALLASRHCVQAQQRKSRQVVIEEYLIRPPAFIVACGAVHPLLALVNVVFDVTAIAGGFGLLLVQLCGVAPPTFDLLVRALQRKIRRLIMVEYRRFPIGFFVALLTPRGEASAVLIVGPVAGNAVGRRERLQPTRRVA